MKIIVCGGRDFHDYKYIHAALYEINEKFPITFLVHGGAKGVDYCAGEWAHKNGIEVVKVDANWKLYGISAGPIRNRVMAKTHFDAKYLVAFPGNEGTEDMVDVALKNKINVIRVPMPNYRESIND